MHPCQHQCISQSELGRVAWCLADCARKPKVPGSSPAASYVQRQTLCGVYRAGGSGTEELKRKPPLFLVSCESLMFVKKKPK